MFRPSGAPPSQGVEEVRAGRFQFGQPWPPQRSGMTARIASNMSCCSRLPCDAFVGDNLGRVSRCARAVHSYILLSDVNVW